MSDEIEEAAESILEDTYSAKPSELSSEFESGLKGKHKGRRMKKIAESKTRFQDNNLAHDEKPYSIFTQAVAAGLVCSVDGQVFNKDTLFEDLDKIRIEKGYKTPTRKMLYIVLTECELRESIYYSPLSHPGRRGESS